MAYIQDIVISITRATKGLKEKSFRPLIMGSGDVKIDLQIVTDTEELISAGYTIEDAEYKMMSAMVSQSPSPVDIAVIRKDDSVTYAEALQELKETFNSYWAICIDSRVESDLNEAGDWANANKKFFFGCNASPGILARNVDREAYLIHNEEASYPECSWVGLCISKSPGSFTWKWKSLNGQNASNFSLTELLSIREKNMQTLHDQKGAIYTNEGRSTSGEFIDIIHGQDWVEDQLETELLLLFLNNDKVALDNPGIAQVESVLRAVLKRAGDNKIIARVGSDVDQSESDDGVYMFKIYTPQRSDLSVNDRANRNLPGIEFEYSTAGAIHKPKVKGLITV